MCVEGQRGNQPYSRSFLIFIVFSINEEFVLLLNRLAVEFCLAKRLGSENVTVEELAFDAIPGQVCG